eukprot:sb/3477575/
MISEPWERERERERERESERGRERERKRERHTHRKIRENAASTTSDSTKHTCNTWQRNWTKLAFLLSSASIIMGWLSGINTVWSLIIDPIATVYGGVWDSEGEKYGM